MRVHIALDDALVAQIDRRSGARNRSRFIREAISAALEESDRWDMILSARGAIADAGHDWDENPAAWVSLQRGIDTDRIR